MGRPAKPGKISNLGSTKKVQTKVTKATKEELVEVQNAIPIIGPADEATPKQTYVLAVYGTLGSENHDEEIRKIMEPCKLIGTGHLPFYHKIASGPYPDIIMSETSMTPVELYEVPEDAFEELDRYEGHYKRIKCLVLTSAADRGVILVTAFVYSFFSSVFMPTATEV